MTMKDDVEAYERDYLKRVQEQAAEKRMLEKEQKEKTAQMEQAQREAEREEQETYVKRTTFTAWDYVLLESIRRKDPRPRIRIGTMKVLASMERLFRAGWIARPHGKMPFDDAERLEAFRDSHEYKQYKGRLNRIMTVEYLTKKGSVFNMLGIKKIDDWLILTEEGRRIAKKKRDRLELVWSRMQKLYSDGMTAEFRQASEKNMEYLPLFVMMGFVNGAMMAQMMSDAHVDYPYWYGDLYGGSSGAWDGSGDFGDAGGGFDGDPGFGGF